MESYKYWSMITGEFLDVLEDEIDTLTPFQVRIKTMPKSNCKVCFGRMYSGKNLNTNLYVPCNKCKKKCIDWESLYNKKQ